MTYFTNWEEFAKQAERLYLQDPMKCRYVIKYTHKEGMLCLRVSDDIECLKYKTQHAQDLKKMEKFSTQLMRHMVSHH